MPKTSFSPTKHGFHFSNSFVNSILNVPHLPKLETSGRCGGMAFASLDYFFAGMPIPTHQPADFPNKKVPADSSRLAKYIYSRLFDSFSFSNVFTWITWTTQADHDTWVYKGVTRLTKEQEFPKLCHAIDQGRPVALGLVGASSLADIGRGNHQVVAYGYDVDRATGNFTVYLYDNNHPNQEVKLVGTKTGAGFKQSTGESWRGFFLTDYTPARPAYFDLGIKEGIVVSSTKPRLNGHFDCRYTVKNYGDYAAHLQNLYLYVRGPHGENLDSLLGGDGNHITLKSGEQRVISKGTEHFGTVAGKYLVGASFFSEQGDWVPYTRAENGTKSEVSLDVKAAA